MSKRYTMSREIVYIKQCKLYSLVFAFSILVFYTQTLFLSPIVSHFKESYTFENFLISIISNFLISKI